MGYCFMSIQKVKTEAALVNKYEHNYREIEVSNADKDCRDLNEELVELPIINGHKQTYHEAYKERIASLPYYKEHHVRADQVRAMEVLLTFSREDFDAIDLEKWKKKNVKWLQKTFDVSESGESNVLSVMYHADEIGNVHLHALVIPIDERGHLNASRFLGGSRVMRALQDDYAKDMKEFGLKRGLQGSPARHQDIQKYYANLNRAIASVPKPLEKESAKEYRDRAIEELEKCYAANLKRINDAERKSIENRGKYIEDTRHEIFELRSQLDILREQMQYIEEEYQRKEKKMEEVRMGRLSSDVIEYMSEYEKIYPERAAIFRDSIADFEQFVDEQERAPMEHEADSQTHDEKWGDFDYGEDPDYEEKMYYEDEEFDLLD